MSLSTHLLHVAAYAHMVDMLINDGGTVEDLYEETGMNRNTIRKFIAAMRRRKVVYVARWEPNSIGRHNIANYRIGNKPDAKQPEPRSNQQKKRDYDERRRKIAASLGVSYKTIRMRSIGKGYLRSPVQSPSSHPSLQSTPLSAQSVADL